MSRLKLAYSAASETFNQGFMVHLAPAVAKAGGLTTVAERPCEWRALARWPEAQRAWNSGARCGLMLPASKTGTLSAAAVARHVVMRSEVVGHAGLPVLSNGQAIQPRFGGAAKPHALRAMRYAVASL